MRATSKLLALALTAAALPSAVAGTVSLNFEDITSVGKITTQYKDAGITVSGDAWGLSSRYNGCTGTAAFLRTNSCGGLLLGVNALGTPSDTDYADFTLDLLGGFVTEVAFTYSVRSGADVLIQLWDGANGTGKVLQQLTSLPGSTCASTGVRFCDWFDTKISFTGVAMSLTVSGLDQRLMLDDLKFTTPGSTGTPLPEPGGVALALGALGALAWTRKRNAR